MLPHQLQAKTVESRNVRRRQKRQFFRDVLIIGALLERGIEFRSDALAHFRRRRLGEGYHQDLIERMAIVFQQPPYTTLDQSARLARAGAGLHQRIAPRTNGALLIRGEITHVPAVREELTNSSPNANLEDKRRI